MNKRKGQTGYRFLVYFCGLLIMSLGFVLFIKSNMGASPWDVLHVGLYEHLGLTVGSWSILMGIGILTVAALISKEFPNIGAFLNMLCVGIFIDFYMMLPIMVTPTSLPGKLMMFISGMALSTYGMGIYISAGLGAGPRDSLMMALTVKTGWKVRDIRAAIEVIVLLIGWKLGGPINWGTIMFSLFIGPLTGLALPQCNAITTLFLEKIKKRDGARSDVTFDNKNRGAKG